MEPDAAVCRKLAANHFRRPHLLGSLFALLNCATVGCLNDRNPWVDATGSVESQPAIACSVTSANWYFGTWARSELVQELAKTKLVVILL